MPDENTMHWQAKLAAWTHDPAEKALILMRTREGHEGGTVRVLQQALFPQGIPAMVREQVKRADRWASAADRPQFPLVEGGGRHQAWTQTHFSETPVLIHPLSAEQYELQKLVDISPQQISAISQVHFKSIIVRDDSGQPDYRKTALAFWRFGPVLRDKEIGSLWELLPADTRVPDHTIWQHLDLTSAFASAFICDAENNPALLSVSFGPVQDFIATARSTSDLWAGSHLLSRIAWEGMKVIAAELGADALIFPQLRGVPLVDLWLQTEIGLPKELFAHEDWRNDITDANPLFAAALPNKLVAVVPADAVERITTAITDSVRRFVLDEAEACLGELLAAAGERNTDDLHCHHQLREQLEGFPEVHWAAVPFAPLVKGDRESLDIEELKMALQPFVGEDGSFLSSESWRLLSRETSVDGAFFYPPNAGVLYPAIYELLDRLGAAAKSIRPFDQQTQSGFRDSMSGESEWLTTNRSQLDDLPGKRSDTLWTKAAGRFGIKKGEHLGALSMLKRVWPKRFTDTVRKAVPDLQELQRYVVSTHAMAVSTSLENWLQGDRCVPPGLAGHLRNAEPVALPRKLARNLSTLENAQHDFLRRLPGLLDQADDCEEDVRIAINRHIEEALGGKPESYYALIQMDGDNMGAWLSGGELVGGRSSTRRFGDTWHPQVRASVKDKFPALESYLNTSRPCSPARHMAISGALNHFSLHLARFVVEDLCKGKLIYAGGDDVLAMVSVDDLLHAMVLLRLAYSGLPLPELEARDHRQQLQKYLQLNKGHAVLNGRLLRLMGCDATASIGAVVAHHQAPLSAVLRRLRETNKRAKSAGRDAFAITLMKRGGGAVELTSPWKGIREDWWADTASSPAGILLALRNEFAGDKFSRRAAYHIQQWVVKLPKPEQMGEEAFSELLQHTLAHQFRQQNGCPELATRFGKLAVALHGVGKGEAAASWICDFLGVAEFLAREGRAASSNSQESEH